MEVKPSPLSSQPLVVNNPGKSDLKKPSNASKSNVIKSCDGSKEMKPSTTAMSDSIKPGNEGIWFRDAIISKIIKPSTAIESQGMKPCNASEPEAINQSNVSVSEVMKTRGFKKSKVMKLVDTGNSVMKSKKKGSNQSKVNFYFLYILIDSK